MVIVLGRVFSHLPGPDLDDGRGPRNLEEPLGNDWCAAGRCTRGRVVDPPLADEQVQGPGEQYIRNPVCKAKDSVPPTHGSDA